MRSLCRATLAMFPLLLSCGGQEPGDGSLSRQRMERWDPRNNPIYVDSAFNYKALELPLEGESARKPWSGDYWATARDSINYRWDGDTSLSPAEKAGKALGLKSFPKWVTEHVGIYRTGFFSGGRKACDASSECEDLKDGSACVKPRAACTDGLTCATVPASKAGRCIPGWWGICHGGAPPAITEPQPVQAVTEGGVTFYPGDLEALASFVYQEDLTSMGLGDRCETLEQELCGAGPGSCRIAISECRDMNPGSMFIALTNLIGLRRIGVVEDVSTDYQVWNQPIRGYRVTNAVQGRLKEISKDKAMLWMGEDIVNWFFARYYFNLDAARFFHVVMEVSYLRESGPGRTAPNPDYFTKTKTYEFILETVEDPNDPAASPIVVGGEWLNSSRTDHPDFMWWPALQDRVTASGEKIQVFTPPRSRQGEAPDYLTYEMVHRLMLKSGCPALSTSRDACESTGCAWIARGERGSCQAP